MSTENVETFSSAQCRAARALLDMTQPDLAAAAGLGLSTVVDFERSRRQLSPEAQAALREALESAGIVFQADGETVVGGPGVRLRKWK
jgi:DNA-binding transcriptional regulator YiaG